VKCEGKRPLGRPRQRGKDSIKTGLKTGLNGMENSSGSLWETLEFIVEAEIAIKQGKFLEDERNVKLIIIIAHP